MYNIFCGVVALVGMKFEKKTYEIIFAKKKVKSVSLGDILAKADFVFYEREHLSRCSKFVCTLMNYSTFIARFHYRYYNVDNAPLVTDVIFVKSDIGM